MSRWFELAAMRRLGSVVFVVFAAFAGAMLVGCETAPQPFAHLEPVLDNPLIELPDSVGILVNPVTGLPNDGGGRLAEAMASALLRASIPADTARSNQNSYVLHGRARNRLANQEADKLTVVWELYDPSGGFLGDYVFAQVIDRRALLTLDDRLLDAVAGASAPNIARLVQPEEVKEAVAVAPRVAIAPVVGAPGDGDRSLTRAIGRALVRRGFELVAEPSGGALVLRGQVLVEAYDADNEMVEIAWTVSTLDGDELGTIRQRNTMPTGTLDGDWGDIAYAIAEGGAIGVVDMIERLESQRAGGQGS